MIIENLTNKGANPVDGDLVKITYSNGSTEQKYFISPSVAPETIPFVAPWTRKEFLLKFAPTEYAAIKAATLVDHYVDYYWALFNAAENVLKTDAVTIAGINALETAGLIGPGRAAEILK